MTQSKSSPFSHPSGLSTREETTDWRRTAEESQSRSEFAIRGQAPKRPAPSNFTASPVSPLVSVDSRLKDRSPPRGLREMSRSSNYRERSHFPILKADTYRRYHRPEKSRSPPPRRGSGSYTASQPPARARDNFTNQALRRLPSPSSTTPNNHNVNHQRSSTLLSTSKESNSAQFKQAQNKQSRAGELEKVAAEQGPKALRLVAYSGNLFSIAERDPVPGRQTAEAIVLAPLTTPQPAQFSPHESAVNSPMSRLTPIGVQPLALENKQAEELIATKHPSAKLPAAAELATRELAEAISILFQRISDEATTVATLKVQKSVAEREILKKESEYLKSKSIYKKFPAIEEANAKDRARTVEVLKATNDKLALQDNVLKSFVVQGAAMLAPTILGARNLDLPQSEYRIGELGKTCIALESQVQEQGRFIKTEQAALEKSEKQATLLQKDIEAINQKVDINQKVIDSFKESSDRIQKSNLEFEKEALKQINKLEGNIDNYSSNLNDVRQLLDRLKEDASKSSAVFEEQSQLAQLYQKNVDELSSEHGSLSSQLRNIMKLEAMHTELKNDILDIEKRSNNSAIVRRLNDAETKITALAPFQIRLEALEERSIVRNAKLEKRVCKVEEDSKSSAEANLASHPVESLPESIINSKTLQTINYRIQTLEMRVDKISSQDKGIVGVVMLDDIHEEVRSSLQLSRDNPSSLDVDGMQKEIMGMVEVIQTETNNLLGTHIDNLKKEVSSLKSQFDPINSLLSTVETLRQTSASHQSNLQQIALDLANSQKTISTIVTSQVLGALRTQPDIPPLLENSQLGKHIADLKNGIEDQRSRFEAVELNTISLERRLNNINTKDQAQYVVSQVADQYPSLRNAINTAGLRADTDKLMARISAVESAQNQSMKDDNALVYAAPLRLEVDKLSEKLMKVSSVANTARDDILRVSSIANAVNDDIFALTENAEVSKKTVARELAASRTAIEAIQSAQNGQQSSEASRPNSRVSVNPPIASSCNGQSNGGAVRAQQWQTSVQSDNSKKRRINGGSSPSSSSRGHHGTNGVGPARKKRKGVGHDSNDTEDSNFEPLEATVH
ncbi:hypothetical protein B0O99DRAFT_276171 [Bisporella sp. PMI_857]|nr:hypothetical protein B0O99DRAFT_276171 [Bisporella sp. PMI_857]